MSKKKPRNRLQPLSLDEIAQVIALKVERCCHINDTYTARKAHINAWLEHGRVMLDIAAARLLKERPTEAERIQALRLRYLAQMPAVFEIRDRQLVFENRPPQWAEGILNGTH